MKIKYQIANIISSALLKINPKTIIFCYHRVIPAQIAKEQFVHRALYVTPITFENHIKWMMKNGVIVGSNEIFSKTNKTKFVITFDDGWKDNFEYAFSLIKKYNIPAIIFISTYNIDKGKLFWTEELSINIGVAKKKKSNECIATLLKERLHILCKKNRTKVVFNDKSIDLSYLADRVIECLKIVSIKERDNILSSLYNQLGVPQGFYSNLLLNWNEISTMSNEGFEIGSHTHTHALLDRVDNETVDSELRLSKEILQQKIGKEVKLFSYPNSYCKNSYIQSSLLAHGYKYAFTLHGILGKNCDFLFIPRCLLFEDCSKWMDKYYLKLMVKNILYRYL